MKRQKVDRSADDMLKAFEYKLYSMKAQSTTTIPEDADVIEAPEDIQASEDEYLEDPGWRFIKSKDVRDSDGFMTEYSMYLLDDGTYGFVFGDRDLYDPSTSYLDYVCDTKEEALNWFDNYTSLADDEYAGGESQYWD